MRAADPLAEKIPANLFREPLEYLLADHVRQTDICAHMYALSNTLESCTPGSRLSDDTIKTIENVVRYLDEDLPLHIADEEVDILPPLRARVLPEDHIENILEELGIGHTQEEELSAELSRMLKTVLSATSAVPSTQNMSELVGKFAEVHCNHMKWENEVLLPLARKRLTPEDQKKIGRTMANRHNIPYPD